MKFKLPAQILAAAFLIGATTSLHAAAYTWSGTGGSWSNTAKWVTASTPATYPNQDGDTALLNPGSGERTASFDVSPTLLSIAMGINGQGFFRFAAASPESPQTITLRANPTDSGSKPFLHVAVATTNQSNGSLTLASGMTISLIGGEFWVGAAGSTARGGAGTVNLESGSGLNIGTSAARSEWVVGQARTRDETRTSSVTGTTGAVVSAHLSKLIIGANDGTLDVSGDGIRGTVNLTTATVSTFDVSGNIVIGRGANHKKGSYGTLSLGKIDTTVGGNITVGDTVAESSGVVNLQGTHMEVGGNVLLDTTGHIRVTLSGESAGLSLSALSTLTINALGASAGDLNAGYHITFSELASPLSLSDIYYGLAWEGDHLTTLNTLVGSHAITWTNLMTGYNPTVFYDLGTNTTYIGVVPEPGSVALAIGGLLFAGIALKQRKDRVSKA